MINVVRLKNTKNERIAQWHLDYGADSILDEPLSLLLPFKSIQAALYVKLLLVE